MNQILTVDLDNRPLWIRRIKYALRTEPGEVYFVRADASGLIKIGWSGDFADRLRNLRTGSPVRLWVLGKCPGAREHEAALHRHFKASRKHGEWFGPAPALMDFIRGLETEPDPFRFAGHFIPEIIL